MAKCYSLWVRSGILCMLFVAALTEDRAILCAEEDSLLPETARNVDIPSQCVLSCTAQTYARMLLRKDKRTIRFTYSQTGDNGYCWSSHISCNAGESLLQAYIVLPIHTSVINEVSLGLQTSSAIQKNVLKPHRREALIPDECGLRFNAMDYFGGKTQEPNFCVEVVPQHRILEEGLQCPPFLVTVWQKVNHDEG